MRPVREGQVWRNRRSGRACVVKMVRLGAVNYRYLLPDAPDGKTRALVMKLSAFSEAFVLVVGAKKGRFNSGSLTEGGAKGGGSTP
jgi:hypothetical protein